MIITLDYCLTPRWALRCQSASKNPALVMLRGFFEDLKLFGRLICPHWKLGDLKTIDQEKCELNATDSCGGGSSMYVCIINNNLPSTVVLDKVY